MLAVPAEALERNCTVLLIPTVIVPAPAVLVFVKTAKPKTGSVSVGVAPVNVAVPVGTAPGVQLSLSSKRPGSPLPSQVASCADAGDAIVTASRTGSAKAEPRRRVARRCRFIAHVPDICETVYRSR